jgi:hypothetical protein
MERENWILEDLLDWVLAYRRCPNRTVLEKRGYHYPPVEPDCDPDSDWLMFERWMQGKPVSWKPADVFDEIPDPDCLTDIQAEASMGSVCERLAERDVTVDYQEGVPARLALAMLRKELTESEFQFTAPGTRCVISGCTGYCPDCFQRPWCKMGDDLEWTEDDEAGGMAVPEVCRPFMKDAPAHSGG